MLRALYMGTGDIAIPSLRALARSQHAELIGLVTGEDKPVGRRQVLTPPAIKTVALELGAPVFQPAKLRPFLPDLATLDPDLLVVMAYGKILPKPVIECPKVACWNLHGSLLPRHRGASPIQAAILAGDLESGVTVMHVAEELDAGDTILAHATPLAADETGGSLHDRLAAIAAEALEDALRQLAAGTLQRTPQDPALVTYRGKLLRADGELDWTRPATELERQIRAYHPWPGTFTTLDGKQRIKIFPPVTVTAGTGARPGLIGPDLTVSTGDGTLQLTTVQPDGKRPMSAAAFIAGHAPEGRQFG